MSDFSEVFQSEVPIKKIAVVLGDENGVLFAIEHPAAPNVTTALYRTVGGQEVVNPPLHDAGRVIYSFATPPHENEFIAVIIG